MFARDQRRELEARHQNGPRWVRRAPCARLRASAERSELTLCVGLCFAVIQSLIALVNDPQPEHPLRADLAEEYSKDRKKFLKNAEEFTKKHGEKRPMD